MRAYIAGPLFYEGERWFDEQIERIASAAGLTTFLPHRDGQESAEVTGPDIVQRIFIEDRDAIDASDIVIANLNGQSIDDGTAWEIGYAYARGKYLIGVFTDMRAQRGYHTVNIMIEGSVNQMVFSLDELARALDSWMASRTA